MAIVMHTLTHKKRVQTLQYPQLTRPCALQRIYLKNMKGKPLFSEHELYAFEEEHEFLKKYRHYPFPYIIQITWIPPSHFNHS